MIPDWHPPTLMNEPRAAKPNPAALWSSSPQGNQPLLMAEVMTSGMLDLRGQLPNLPGTWPDVSASEPSLPLRNLLMCAKQAQMQPHLKSIGKSYSDKGLKQNLTPELMTMTC